MNIIVAVTYIQDLVYGSASSPSRAPKQTYSVETFQDDRQAMVMDILFMAYGQDEVQRWNEKAKSS
jgi:hypothetical protein